MVLCNLLLFIVNVVQLGLNIGDYKFENVLFISECSLVWDNLIWDQKFANVLNEWSLLIVFAEHIAWYIYFHSKKYIYCITSKDYVLHDHREIFWGNLKDLKIYFLELKFYGKYFANVLGVNISILFLIRLRL